MNDKKEVEEKRCWICGRTFKEAETAIEGEIAQWKAEKKITEGYDYGLPMEVGFIYLRLLKKLKNGGWMYVDEREKDGVKLPIVASMPVFLCRVCSALMDAKIEETYSGNEK